MTQLPGNDTTMTQLSEMCHANPMTLMTQLLKASLRARTRRQGFESHVMSVITSLLFFSYDTYDTSLNNEASIRGRTHAHAHSRDLNLWKSVS